MKEVNNMANARGDQAIWVTEGYEEKIAERYREIKELIQKNTSISFEKAIQIIGGVSKGTWYNYISKGKQRGRVSKHTVNRLSEFSELPEKIFTGEKDFTEKDKEVFVLKIKEKLNINSENSIKNIETAEILEDLKILSQKVDFVNEIETIDSLKLLLDNIIIKVQ